MIHGISGPVQGVSCGFEGFQEVSGAFQGCSRACQVILGGFKGLPGMFQMISGGFRGVPEDFRKFQGDSMGLREFQEHSKRFQSI